jgi:hypothetical protein
MSHRLIVVLAGVCLFGDALAQDQRPRPAPRVAAAPPAAAASLDPEAQAAKDEARAARERAGCLMREAQAVDAAVRQLALGDDRNGQRRAALMRARRELGGCDSAPSAAVVAPEESGTGTGSTRPSVENISVEWPKCRAGDPMCNDTSTFDAAPIVRIIRQHRSTLAQCVGTRRGGDVRLAIRLREIDDRARPSAITVEDDGVGDPDLNHCLRRSLARLVFPSVASEARVRLTLKVPASR